jgi:repressor LexA
MPKKTQMTEQIYNYLKTVIPQQGYAPSVREICEAVGLKSPSTVHFHLKRLQEQGLIEKGDFKGRAIVLVDTQEKNRIPILGQDADYFALRVRGESMLGAGILPDDLVVVRRQQSASSGEIVVALLGDEATVKRLSHRNGGVWLLPENDAFQPIDGRNALVLGKVTAVVRQYS